MPNPPTSDPRRALTERDRDDLTRRLNDAFTEGGIETERYRELLDVLYAGHTMGDVAAVVASLPALQTHAVPAIVERGTSAPGELSLASDPRRPALLAAGGLTVGVLLAVVLLLLILL